MLKYLQPKSLTWWAGVLSVLTGMVTMFPEMHPAFFEIGDILTRFTGGAAATPAGLIVTGLGLIGIRAKLERG